MKLSPFKAMMLGMVFSMTFSIICALVILLHIHQNFPSCK